MDSLYESRIAPIARKGAIVFSDSTVVVPCNFDILNAITPGTFDAKSLKIEMLYAYNIAGDIASTIKQAVMNGHNDQFDDYLMVGIEPDSTNKALAAVYSFYDSTGNHAKYPYSAIIFVTLPDPALKSGNTNNLWVDGGVPYECLGYTDASNSKWRMFGESIGRPDSADSWNPERSARARRAHGLFRQLN